MKANFYDRLVFRTPVLAASAIEERYGEPAFDHALYVASPNLYDALQKETNDAAELKKLAISTYKYYSRMTNRCTPFGLFSAVGTALWSDHSEIKLGETMHASVRLDMAYVVALVNHLLGFDSVKQHSTWLPNNTLSLKEDKFTYFESQYAGNKREYQLTGIERNEYIDLIFEKSKNGAKHHQFQQAIQELDPDLSSIEIEAYLYSIYDSQFLMNELHAGIVGEFHFAKLLRILDRIQEEAGDLELKKIHSTLLTANELLQHMTSNQDCTVEKYRELEQILTEIKLPINRSFLSQTDLFVPEQQATLSRELQQPLSDAIAFLGKLSFAKHAALEELKPELSKRFGSKAVPLLDLFSEKSGLTYPVNNQIDDTPLLNGLSFSAHKPLEGSVNINFADKLLTQKLQHAFKNELFEVEFTAKDLESFSALNNQEAGHYFALFSCFPENKYQMQLHTVGVGSGANFLGRFSYGDPSIHQLMKQMALDEAAIFPERILADIVHLPDDRLGNVTSRLNSHSYEIPIYTGSSTDAQQILLEDLYVKLQDDNLILWSEKLGKEIIPRLTNAHNFAGNSIPVYRFLCDLQYQTISPLNKFEWGNFAFMFKFRPRAIYQGVILREAHWVFTPEDVLEMTSEYKQNGSIESFAGKWKLPIQFQLVQGDNTLVINRMNAVSVAALIAEIKEKDEVQLSEMIHDDGTSLILDQVGKTHRNEVLAFFKNEDFVAQAPAKRPTIDNQIQQTCFPGSKWLFYKIYLPSALHEQVLKRQIHQLVMDLKQEKLIDGFFFIKYFDPDFHLRLRFKIEAAENRAPVFEHLNRAFQHMADKSLLWNYQIDTYQRELDRYGWESIEETESLFSIDSFYNLNLLAQADRNEWILSDTHKLQYAFLTSYKLICFFCKDQAEILEFSEYGYRAYLYEHGDSKELRHDLDKFYRLYRSDFENLILNEAEAGSPELELIVALSNMKMESETEVLQRIQDKMRQAPIDKFMYLSSVIHMSANRLFHAKQRSYELLLYALLIRCLRSIYARLRKQETSTT